MAELNLTFDGWNVCIRTDVERQTCKVFVSDEFEELILPEKDVPCDGEGEASLHMQKADKQWEEEEAAEEAV